MIKSELHKQFQGIDDDLNHALVTNNADEISKHLSNDWTLVQAQYGIITKEKFLQAVRQGDLHHSDMKKEVLDVKLYNDVAVVTSRGINSGLYKDKVFHTGHWNTNVYRKENENWLCVLSHETPVSC